MTLKPILILQLIWIGLGAAYNAISHLQISTGKAALAPTDPSAGLIFMAICAAVVCIGLIGWRKTYGTLAAALTLLLAYSGVFSHANAYLTDATLPNYACMLAWALAILINVFGVSVLALGSWRALTSAAE